MNKKLRMAGAILLSAVMMFSISAFAENSADDTNIISEEMTENESSGKKVYSLALEKPNAIVPDGTLSDEGFAARVRRAKAENDNALRVLKEAFYVVDVELGNDPARCDDDGGTVLSWSALNPDARVLEFLIEHGAGIGDACFGGTELDIALKEGTPDRVRFFVEHGSDLECISMYSFIDAPLENIRVLLECGLNPDYEDAYGDGRLVDILDPARKALFVEFGAKPK